MWGQEAVYLVEDDQGLELARPRAPPYPRQELFEDHSEHELPLFVVEMGHADNDAGRAPLAGGDPVCDIEARSLAPTREGGRRQQGVERGGQALPLRLSHEGIDR